MTTATAKLEDAVRIHQTMVAYRNDTYINLIQQINTKASAVLKDDLGTQFIQNCGRDIAGEIVRNCFDTSNFNITVDQLASRILKFKYEDEYDPLAENGGVGEIQKSVYGYHEFFSGELDAIIDDLDAHQERLFSKSNGSDRYDDQYNIDKQKKKYREQQRAESADGLAHDEYTQQAEAFKTRSDGTAQSNLDVDHIQDLDGAKYNSKYITQDGKEALAAFYNSSDNFAMTLDAANRSKNAVKVYDKDGNDITHRATPEQLADAVCEKWESKGDKQDLIDQGYLNEDGTVPKSIKAKLVANIRHSQNAESKVILKNTDYKEVGKEAATHTKAAIGKIIAGQIIYYTAPPLVYEIRRLIKERRSNLDNILTKLGDAAGRIGNYVISKLKDIFQNVLFSSLKKFIKSFMDILINMVKATIKKLLKIAKNLALSVVDAIRIIADPNASAAEKADSVFNLFGVTVTNCAIEVLFELLEQSLKIPEAFLMPLQLLTTVICTNLTMLILQKADLFDVRFGFKINAMKKVFQEDYEKFSSQMQLVENAANAQIDRILESAKAETRSIYDQLQALDPKRNSVRSQLNSINTLFSVQIEYDDAWDRFLSHHSAEPDRSTDPIDVFRTDYKQDKPGALAAAALIQYFKYYDPYILESVNPQKLQLPQNAQSEFQRIQNASLFTFSEVRRYLDQVSQNTIMDLAAMVDVIMKSGKGPTAAKNTAKKRFDYYCENYGTGMLVVPWEAGKTQYHLPGIRIENGTIHASVNNLEGFIFKGFPCLNAQNIRFSNCVFDSCLALNVSDCNFAECEFKQVGTVIADNTYICECGFSSLYCDSDSILSLKSCTVVRCTFSEIVLRSGAHLCSSTSDVQLQDCSYINCSTDRLDQKLIQCVGPHVLILQRRKAYNTGDSAAHAGL